ncbi:DUF6460 domain-containing protein [Enterovirga aerilata]|uniref:Integrase n=1 Tax=Enterovirga aerilata TaxID=2730920 RepID=A0A849I3E4_9HYPH|nr:DUF6460 domain-containing protein [Enterovirga sp. DB1703]NNM70905.1 integrase [Enterovirga sp. DB1703]
MSSAIQRLFGGSPLLVLFKLLFLSLVIGAIMAGFGFTPTTLPSRIAAAARSLWNLGFGALRNAGAYILTGAMVVVPIWLLMRFMGGKR